MLSKNEFFDSVKRNIINFLPDEVRDGVEIDETTIVKMNDKKLHGLIIKEKGADYCFVGMNEFVTATLEKTGFSDHVGKDHIYKNLEEYVASTNKA